MGEISVMVFTFITKGCFDFPLALVSEACCRNPFFMKEQFALRCKTDNTILFKVIQLKEHLVVIIPPVHDEGSFPKEGGSSSTEKVTSLMEVKFFSFEEWISEKMLVRTHKAGFIWIYVL